MGGKQHWADDDDQDEHRGTKRLGGGLTVKKLKRGGKKGRVKKKPVPDLCESAREERGKSFPR